MNKLVSTSVYYSIWDACILMAKHMLKGAAKNNVETSHFKIWCVNLKKMFFLEARVIFMEDHIPIRPYRSLLLTIKKDRLQNGLYRMWSFMKITLISVKNGHFWTSHKVWCFKVFFGWRRLPLSATRRFRSPWWIWSFLGYFEDFLVNFILEHLNADIYIIIYFLNY